MPGRLPIPRDTGVLLAVFLVGASVLFLVPPGATTAPTSVRSMGRTRGSDAAGGGGGGAPRADPPTDSGGPPATTSAGSESAASATPGGGRADTATRSTGSSRRPSRSATDSASKTGGSDRIKLTDSKYARYAYLISNRNLSDKADRALDGFRRTRTRVNASAVRVTLTPYEPRYDNYSVLVRNDQRLYFVETSLSDDAPKRETELDDDAPVKVDGNGYVIQ